MFQLTAIIVRKITQRHNYRWNVTTEIYITMILLKKSSTLFVKY